MEFTNRRMFLKTLAASGALMTLTGMPWLKVLAKDGSTPGGPNDRVRLGFIGIGSRGTGLLKNVLYTLKESNAEIAALCDNYPPNLEKAQAMCKEWNPPAYDDYRRVLEDDTIDAVIIATPLHQHAHIAIDAMLAGKQVFCEKSMARTLEDIRAMYDTHLETGKILQIGHQRLFDPKYIDAIQRIQRGELGKIGQIRAYWHRNNNWRRPVPEGRPDLEKKINWRMYRESSAGLITELASHQIQVANWVMGEPPVSVMGAGSIVYWKDGREVYDNVALIYTYSNGMQFIYDSMISNMKYGLEEQIMGDKGTMELEVNKYYTETPPPAPGILQLINDIEHGIFDNIPIGGATWVPETASKYDGEAIYENAGVDETLTQLQAFIDYVREGKAPEELTREGYNASIWAILGETAIDTGQKLSMPPNILIS